jgi:pimeloyl-ACP methyl ester carboxylesterase
VIQKLRSYQVTLCRAAGSCSSGKYHKPPRLIRYCFLALYVFCGANTALSVESQTAPKTRDGFFDSDGLRIHYVVAGTGMPMILVHGFSGSAASIRGVQIELAREYRVIAIDCRGHGKSDRPHEAEKYGREMSDDIARLLSHLQVKAAHIVGYSMGARIASRFLVDHPDQVLSAVLGGAAPEIAGSASPAAEVRRRTAESLEAGNGAGPLIEFLAPVGQAKPDAAQIAMANRLMLAANDPLALAAVMRAMGGLAVNAEALKANERPVLAIVGSLDPYLGAVKALTTNMGNVEVSVIEGGSHASVIGQPSEFLARVRSFLQRH